MVRYWTLHVWIHSCVGISQLLISVDGLIQWSVDVEENQSKFIGHLYFHFISNSSYVNQIAWFQMALKPSTFHLFWQRTLNFHLKFVKILIKWKYWSNNISQQNLKYLMACYAWDSFMCISKVYKTSHTSVLL